MTKKQAVIEVPAGFQHFAHVYECVLKFEPDQRDQYVVHMPYTPALAGCHITSRGDVRASSQRRPFILIGEGGSPADVNNWYKLLEKADRWGIKRDVLLTGRPLQVAIDLFEPSRIVRERGAAPFGAGLRAVQILGDLTKSEALDEKIADIKSMFEQER